MAILFSNFVKNDIDESKVLNASDWLREKASEVERVDTSKVIRKNSTAAVSRIISGHLYLYRYDPKLQQELPYYDIFPVVFPIQKTQGGFLGLNLHYLPFTYRARLMDALYEYVTGEEDLQKVKITYKILSSIAKLRYYKPCLKHYLNSHVKSRFLHIDPEEWDIALFLPLQKFKKASMQQVHRDSIRTIRQSNLRGIKR